MEFLKEKIPELIYQKLIYSNINSIQQILLLNDVELEQNIQLSKNEIETLTKTLKSIVLKNKFQTAFDIKKWQRISTGCESIDTITNKGIPVNGITEIFGCSGVGKTQFCLQLSIMVQLPLSLGGLEKGTIYICTEDTFPSKRLHQLANEFSIKHNLQLTFEDNIYIKHIADYEQLRRLLVQLPNFLENHNIGLIVIDSIAGIFRSENNVVNYLTRSQQFQLITNKLNKFVDKFGLAVLCTNQVTDDVTTNQSNPCLGLAWSNLITCRFSICKNNFDSVRQFEVIFAPDLPDAQCNFLLTTSGLADVN